MKKRALTDEKRERGMADKNSKSVQGEHGCCMGEKENTLLFEHCHRYLDISELQIRGVVFVCAHRRIKVLPSFHLKVMRKRRVRRNK